MSLLEAIDTKLALNWKKDGVLDSILPHLAKVQAVEAAYKSQQIEMDVALQGISVEIDPALQKIFKRIEINERQIIQDRDAEILVLGEGVYQLPADNCGLIATFIPQLMDIIAVAYSFYEGAVISVERAFKAKHLKPAFGVILETPGTSIVDLLFGENQLNVNEWFEESVYKDMIRAGIDRTFRNFKEMLSNNKFKSPEEITLFMSGIGVGDPNYFSPGILELIKQSSESVDWRITPDLKQLGKSAGWIYGGVSSATYSVPVPYLINNFI